MKENELPFDPEDHYGDGVTAGSYEGRRRSVANIREIRRRLGKMSAAKAVWRMRAEARVRRLKAVIESGFLSAGEAGRRQETIDRIEAEIEASKPKAVDWDFRRGCPEGETGPQDVQDGPEEDFDFDVDRDTDPAAAPF